MNYLERAFNAVKYREYSPHPALDISIPPSTIRREHPRVVMFGHCAVCALWAAGGLGRAQRCGLSHREHFTALVLDKIAEYAPGIKEQVVAASC